MTKKENIVFKKTKESSTYKAALERAPEDDREKIEDMTRALSEKLSGIVDKLFYISQDPKLSAKLREELIRMSKNPTSLNEEVTEDGES